MLSVLIVNWNTRDLLDACLTSLAKFPPVEGMEVIVVDNASTDESAEMVTAKHPGVTLIQPGSNTGYAHGNNLAMAAARGEWLLTLNPDTEVYADTLQIAIEKLKANPGYGALGARQIYTDGTTQHSVRGFPTVGGIFADITHLGRDTYRLRDFDYEKEQAAPQPMGTFLLFRRAALEEVAKSEVSSQKSEGAGELRPFDEAFPIFFNEVDLLYRLQKAGWPTLYSPDVRVLHYGGEGTKQVRKNMIWESHRSLARFLEKHHPSPALPLVKGLIWLGALVRAKGVHAGFRP
jgi:GT2 family glycosyltransferase